MFRNLRSKTLTKVGALLEAFAETVGDLVDDDLDFD